MTTSSHSPLVSVVMPVFNRLPFLRTAIESIRAQTYTRWELLVANDGSDHTTSRYLAGLADEDRRIQVLTLAHSGKPSIPRNAALHRARGDYIAFLDSDDAWLPTKLLIQLDVLRASPKTRWSYTAVEHINDNGGPATHRQEASWLPLEGHILESLLTVAAYVATPTVIAERSLIEETGGFDTTLKFGEDYDLWIRFAIRSPVALVDQKLTRVRRHATNHSHDRPGFHRDWITLYEKAERLLSNPRLQHLCRTQRRQLVVALAVLQAKDGDWRAASHTIAVESVHSWASTGFWIDVAKAGFTPLRAFLRQLHTTQPRR
ncbi:MAG: glycosyltransferase [Polyangiaceae bacterium]|jgi:glycosyltransferase involved in cell wall biosynthesis